MNIKTIKPNSKKLVYIILSLSAIALILRAGYSFCWSDESFYFSTTNRFIGGDHIFVHEWFPTQLVSLILLPFQWIYVKLTGGNNGIILFFRIVYVVVSYAFSIAIFNIIKKHKGIFTGLVCSLFCMFYVHLNIATTSYYSLSFFFFLTSMLLLYDSVTYCKESGNDALRINNTVSFILSGTLFALAVLSLPSLAVVYFICAIFLVICSIKNTLARKIFVLTLIGIIIPAILVLMYVLPTSGISGITDNLKYVLSDEEHTTSLVYPFKNFFISVYDVFGKYPVYLSGLLSLTGFIYTALQTAGDKFPDKIYAGVIKFKSAFGIIFETIYFICDVLLALLYFYKAVGHTGFAATVLLLFAMPLFFITPSDKRDHLMFGLIFMGGMIFSMVYSYSSLCDLYVLSIGHNIAAVAGICFIMDYIRCVNNRYLTTVCIGIVMALLLQTMTLRFVNVYRDAPLSELTQVITDGPAKGLHTTNSHKESYDQILEVLRDYDQPGKNLFISKLLPWGYMATDMKCATPTTWRTMASSDRLNLYYEEHPERFPDVILILNNTVGAYDSCGDVVADPTPNDNELSGYLFDKITGCDYKTIETSVGTIYIKD